MTQFNQDGIMFEATNMTERGRIVNYGYEVEYLGMMLACLRPDDVLYDIGANIGTVAIHAAATCPTVAFEPDPEFRARLRRNLELNPGLLVTDTSRHVRGLGFLSHPTVARVVL